MWSTIVGEDWYNLDRKFWDSEYNLQLLKFISDRYQKSTVFPPMKDVFKAFRKCKLKDFKVLILGQDPYPDGNATGLAFANPEDTIRINPSLQKIFDTIERDCYNGLKVEFDVTLEQWAEQGVLLLNTALTVEKFNVASHSKYWNKFTTDFLTMLSNSGVTGLHVCLWGNHAKAFKKYLNEKIMYIYESTHPAHASYNKINWECDHFKKINNEIFKQNGKEEIIAW